MRNSEPSGELALSTVITLLGIEPKPVQRTNASQPTKMAIKVPKQEGFVVY